MRFLVANLHRAFPELDPFPDTQAIGYVTDAYKQFSGVVNTWRLVGTLVCCTAFFLSCPLSSILAAAITPLLSRGADESPFMIGVFLPGWFLAGWSFFALRDHGLRKAIRNRLEGARCTKCHYSLLGLAVRDERVRCPECGHEELLAARGLSAADILGVIADPTPAAPPADPA